MTRQQPSLSLPLLDQRLGLRRSFSSAGHVAMPDDVQEFFLAEGYRLHSGSAPGSSSSVDDVD